MLCALGIQAGWASPNPCINNPTWYISVLLLCYVVFWLLTDFAKRKGIPVELLYAGMIALGVVERYASSRFGFEVAFLNHMSCRGYYAFFAGLLVACYLPSISFTRRRLAAVAAVWCITLALGRWYHGFFLPLWLTFVAYPCLLFFVVKSPVHRFFQHTIWQTLGAASYDVYVWHVICLVLLMIVHKQGIVTFDPGQVMTMLLTALLAECVGLCSYRWLEHRLTTPAKRLATYFVG